MPGNVSNPRACELIGECFDGFGQQRTGCPPASFAGEGLALAEDLCPRTMARTAELRDRDTASAVLKSAWSLTELGLKLGQSDPDASQEIFERATSRLDMIVGNEDDQEVVFTPNTITFLGARSLSAFMPAFVARSQPDNTFGVKGCNKIYEDLVDTLSRLDTRERRDSRGHVIEVKVMALSARASDPARLTYPASPREESNSGQRSTNHDVYTLKAAGGGSLRKLPIQIKATALKKGKKGSRYSAAVSKLFYREHILNHVIQNGNGTVRGTDTLIEHLIGDIDGSNSPEMAEDLDLATQALIAFVDTRTPAAVDSDQ